MILAANIYRMPRNKYGARPPETQQYSLYFKQYSLFSMESRSFKTCGRLEALKLLATGKWFDKTVYTPIEIENNEVLSYGKENDIEQNSFGVQLAQREKSEHQLDNPNCTKLTGTERSSEAVWSGRTENKVGKRGRPKRSV
jgi:hypothetical protein